MGFNWDLTGISWDLMGVSMDSCENVNRIFHGEHHGVPWFSHGIASSRSWGDFWTDAALLGGRWDGILHVPIFWHDFPMFLVEFPIFWDNFATVFFFRDVP